MQNNEVNAPGPVNAGQDFMSNFWICYCISSFCQFFVDEGGMPVLLSREKLMPTNFFKLVGKHPATHDRQRVVSFALVVLLLFLSISSFLWQKLIENVNYAIGGESFSLRKP